MSNVLNTVVPVGYSHNAVEKLNSGLPGANPDNGKEDQGYSHKFRMGVCHEGS